MNFKSDMVEVADAQAAVELFFERKWTDGLAVVPPTEKAVTEMIEYAGRDYREELGEIPPYGGVATIEKLAINSVMAGCRPEYFPVVIAAVEACLDPKHNLNGTQTTQDGAEQLIIVNGPIANRLGINSGDGVFGRGYRANGTIGRALRLVLWNLGKNYPGEPDRSALSHPGAWSFCIAENDEDSPWEPLCVEKGLPPGSNAVTVFQCEAPNPFLSLGSCMAEEVLFSACEAMCNPASGTRVFRYWSEVLLTLNPQVAEQMAKEGWSKKDVKNYVWEHSRIPFWKIKKTGTLTSPESAGTDIADMWWPKWIDRSNPDTMVPPTGSPEDIHVIVAGGRGAWSAVLDGWGLGGRAVTKEIKLPK